MMSCVRSNVFKLCLVYTPMNYLEYHDKELHSWRSKALTSIHRLRYDLTWGRDNSSDEDPQWTPLTKEEEREYELEHKPADLIVADSAVNIVENINVAGQNIYAKLQEHRDSDVIHDANALNEVHKQHQRNVYGSQIADTIALFTVPYVMFTKTLGENNLRQINASLYDTYDKKTGLNKLNLKQLKNRLQGDDKKLHDIVFDNEVTQAYQKLKPIRDGVGHRDLHRLFEYDVGTTMSLKEGGVCVYEHMKPLVHAYMKNTEDIYNHLSEKMIGDQ